MKFTHTLLILSYIFFFGCNYYSVSALAKRAKVPRRRRGRIIVHGDENRKVVQQSAQLSRSFMTTDQCAINIVPEMDEIREYNLKKKHQAKEVSVIRINQ